MKKERRDCVEIIVHYAVFCISQDNLLVDNYPRIIISGGMAWFSPSSRAFRKSCWLVIRKTYVRKITDSPGTCRQHEPWRGNVRDYLGPQPRMTPV